MLGIAKLVPINETQKNAFYMLSFLVIPKIGHTF